MSFREQMTKGYMYGVMIPELVPNDILETGLDWEQVFAVPYWKLLKARQKLFLTDVEARKEVIRDQKEHIVNSWMNADDGYFLGPVRPDYIITDQIYYLKSKERDIRFYLMLILIQFSQQKILR